MFNKLSLNKTPRLEFDHLLGDRRIDLPVFDGGAERRSQPSKIGFKRQRARTEGLLVGGGPGSESRGGVVKLASAIREPR